MISIDRLEEMAIEELQTKLKNFEEQIKLQNNFIDSLLKATNNSEWLDKSMLDDEASEVIEKIELDYEQLDQLKAANDEKNELLAQLGCPTVGTARQLTLSLKEQLEAYKMEAEEGKEINAELKAENEELQEKIKAYDEVYSNHDVLNERNKLKQTLTEIKEIAEEAGNTQYLTFPDFDLKQNVKMLMGQFNGYLQQILQKISEVENG